MKKIILNLLAAAFIVAISSAETKAQVSVGVGVNVWTPPADYSDANYYYLPDVDGYYYVPTHQYVYMDGGRWVFRASLPSRYSSYDIRTGYKVAVYRPHPYRYYSHDRVTYGRYRGHGGGVIVRDHYRSRYVSHTRVINRTHYRTRYVHSNHYAHSPHRSTVHHGYVHHSGQSHSRPHTAHVSHSHSGGGHPRGGEHGHGHH